MGKGDGRRPAFVSSGALDDAWTRTFGAKVETRERSENDAESVIFHSQNADGPTECYEHSTDPNHSTR